MTLKKLKKLKVFLVFLDKLMVKDLWKTKKTQVFLVFCMDCFYMSSKNLSKKPKKTWVFLVFWLTSSKSSSKKPKKPWLFFSFFKVMTKKKQKNSRKTKKNKHEPQTKHSLKSFGFLVFSRFFGFWFSRGLASRGRRICEAVTSGPYLILVSQLCFSFLSPYIQKNTFHYRPLVSTISICKRLSPKYVRHFILNFFPWRPDFFKGK